MVETKAAGALDVKVFPAAQRTVRADDDLLAPSGELDRCKLLLVVLLEGGRKLGHDARVGDCEGFDVWRRLVRNGCS